LIYKSIIAALVRILVSRALAIIFLVPTVRSYSRMDAMYGVVCVKTGIFSEIFKKKASHIHYNDKYVETVMNEPVALAPGFGLL
jgi:hypothetical protein